MKKSEQKVTEEVRRLKQEYPKKKKTKKNI